MGLDGEFVAREPLAVPWCIQGKRQSVLTGNGVPMAGTWIQGMAGIRQACLNPVGEPKQGVRTTHAAGSKQIGGQFRQGRPLTAQ